MKQLIFFMLNFFISINIVHSQSVSINNDGSPPDTNAILDVKSTTKGVLLPRMTTAQRMAILNPPEGLMIYDTDMNSVYFTDTSGMGDNWMNVMHSNLELPYSQGGSFTDPAFAIFNNNNDTLSITAKFNGGLGTGINSNGKIGGNFFGTQYGILVEGSTAAKFYSGDVGVHINVNGDPNKALLVENGLTGLGTMNPQAKLHVFKEGASGQTPLLRVTRKEEGQPELGLTFQLDQQYAGQPDVAYGSLGMMSNTRLNLITNNDIENPALSILDNKVGINMQDGSYSFNINGKTGFYDNNTFVGEIFGHPSNGNLYINAKTGPNSFSAKNIILQTPTNGFDRSGLVGIKNNTPNAILDVQNPYPYPEYIPVAKFGHSTFDQGEGRETKINGGTTEGGSHGNLYLNSEVPTNVIIAEGGGDVFLPNINTKMSIGTSDTTQTLNVKGTIRSSELIIDSDWADYVFNNTYELKNIEEVEKYIKLNGHLPNMPSSKKIKEDGLKVSEISTKMMEKIEELTLYIIEQQKELNLLKNQISKIK